MSIGLFDILKDISHSKRRILSSSEDFKEYNPFMINRFVSNHPSSVHMADYMNRYPNLPKELQYEFYMTGLTAENRYFKYQKADKAGKDIKIIMDYYGVSEHIAEEYSKVLTDTDIKNINEIMNKGGRHGSTR